MNLISVGALASVAVIGLAAPAAAQPPAATPGNTYQCPGGVTLSPASIEGGKGPQAWIDGRGAVARAYSGAISGQLTVVDDGRVVAVDYAIDPYRANDVPVREAALRGTVECSTAFTLQGEGALDAEFADFLRLDEPDLIGREVIVDVTVHYSVHLTQQQLAARI